MFGDIANILYVCNVSDGPLLWAAICPGYEADEFDALSCLHIYLHLTLCILVHSSTVGSICRFYSIFDGKSC